MAVVNLADRARAVATLRQERPQQLAALADVVAGGVQALLADAGFCAAVRAAVRGVAEAAGEEQYGSYGAFGHGGAEHRLKVDVKGRTYQIYLPSGACRAGSGQLADDARGAADVGLALQSGNMAPAQAGKAVATLLQASTMVEAYDFVKLLNGNLAAALLANNGALFPGVTKLTFELAHENPPSKDGKHRDPEPTGLILALSFAGPDAAQPSTGSAAAVSAGATLHDAGLAGIGAHQNHLAQMRGIGGRVGARLGLGLLEPAFLEQFLAAFDMHVTQRAAGRARHSDVPIGGNGAFLKVDIAAHQQWGEGSFAIKLPLASPETGDEQELAFVSKLDGRDRVLAGVDEPGPLTRPWLARVSHMLSYAPLYTAERDAMARAVADGVTGSAGAQFGTCLGVSHGAVLEVSFRSPDVCAALRAIGK